MTTNQISSEKSNPKYTNLALKNKKIKSQEIPLISIIIPLYNEENTIKNVIERIPNHYPYEIILVDDGSTDHSVERVKEIKNKNIKIVLHLRNKGYGEALLTGFKIAKGDIIITLDSDGQHNPEEIPTLIQPLINNQADVVVGSRYLGKCHYKTPLYARVGGYVINLVLWLLFLLKVYDNQCGFRAFKKDVIKIMNHPKYTDMGFSTELLFKSAFYKYKIIEVPISINARKFGTSYVNLIRIIRSISSCIVYYTLRKFKLELKHALLLRIINYGYKRLKSNKLCLKIFKF